MGDRSRFPANGAKWAHKKVHSVAAGPRRHPRKIQQQESRLREGGLYHGSLAGEPLIEFLHGGAHLLRND